LVVAMHGLRPRIGLGRRRGCRGRRGLVVLAARDEREDDEPLHDAKYCSARASALASRSISPGRLAWPTRAPRQRMPMYSAVRRNTSTAGSALPPPSSSESTITA